MPGCSRRGVTRSSGPAALLASALIGLAPAPLLGATDEAEALSSLQWVRLPGSEECTGAPELARAVEERMGRPVFVSAAQGNWAVEGHVERTGSGFGARISVARADGTIVGTRELETTESCRALDESLVVIIALLLDPEGVPDGSSTEKEPSVERRDEATWDWSAHVGFSALVGPLPTLTGALQLGVGVGKRPIGGIEATAVSTLAVTASGIPGRFRLYGGELAACRILAEGTGLRMGTCLGAQAGVVRGVGHGLEHREVTGRPYAGVLGRARVGAHLFGPLWCELEGGVSAMVLRPSFFVSGLNPNTLGLERRDVWRAEPWALQAGVRLAAAF